MKLIPTELDGAYLIEPDIFEDHRGCFFESFSKEKIAPVFNGEFVQDNQSLSRSAGTLRGLHCQKEPWCQSKLVRVINGAVDDVVVDIRKGSPTYLHWLKVRLTAENKLMLFMPKGFLHGFVTLTDDVIFCYKVDQYYHRESEQGVAFDDPLFGIDWGINNPVLSDKDRINPRYSEANLDFVYSTGESV